jgi:drug/metabolite transporter (DMT)-like permease
MPVSRLVVAVLTLVTLAAFAANSLLCRMALGPRLIDPVTFTVLRLASGAAILAPLSVLLSGPRRPRQAAGSWRSSAALFVYAMAFSLAYVSLETGTGALILFGSVQLTMIGAGLWQGERPKAQEWLGLAVAMAGLVTLVWPGISAPDSLGALLMIASGVAWGVYSLRGRQSGNPIAATAGNFARTLPFAAGALVASWAASSVTPRGAALALVSGAITSGLGYVIWYLALRDLTATRAAIVQLAVPLLAAAGGTVVLDEEPTARLAVASVLILGGVASAVLAKASPGNIDACDEPRLR